MAGQRLRLRRRASLGALAVVALALACSGERKGSGAPPRPPVPVVVAEVRAQDVTDELPAVGTAQSSLTVSVRPLVTGEIVGVFFNTQRAWGRPNLGPDRRLTEVAA